jgi:Spy/CpxP family protein refolding chaperone
MFASRFCRRATHAAIASALLAAVATTAQAGPGFGGPHGPGARGAHVEHVIAQVRSQLNLNSQQQVAFDNAVANTRAAREAGRAEMDKVRAAMQAELAKPAPDLRHVADIADQAQAAALAQRRQLRDQWLALYDTFSAEQKLVVRDALQRRAERMDTFRERMRGRSGG